MHCLSYQTQATTYTVFGTFMTSYIRGLESLGQCQDSYGTFLVPIVISKLPTDIRKHLAREHGNDNWQIGELRNAINKEITIIEAGQSAQTPEVHDATASFFAGTRSKPRRPNNKNFNTAQRTEEKKCPFCDDHHSANACKKVTSYESRVAIVKQKRLCFNCLGSHIISVPVELQMSPLSEEASHQHM